MVFLTVFNTAWRPLTSSWSASNDLSTTLALVIKVYRVVDTAYKILLVEPMAPMIEAGSMKGNKDVVVRD